MSHIFISYSRKDLAIAEKIINALAKDDLEPWIDWKSIPKGETFEKEIQQGIEKADVFLFLVSPDSVQSDWCNKEIDHAVKNGKRILPIVIRDADSKSIHPEISKRNWIFCREGQYDFDKTIEEICETIHTDYEWLKYHTELQVKALKWDLKKDNSRLLRGKELREAEQLLVAAGSQKDPQPTDLQRDFVVVSRKDEKRRILQVRIFSIVFLVLAIAVSIVGSTLLDRTPAKVGVNGQIFEIRNRSGFRFLKQDVGSTISVYTGPQKLAPNDEYTLIVGTAMDGKRPGTVLTYDMKGNIKWEYSVHDDPYNGPPGNFQIRDILKIDQVLDNEQSQIIFTAQKSDWFPTELIMLDAKGNLLASYWNSGFIYDILPQDFDGDGIKELVISAVNNNLGYLVVKDEKKHPVIVYLLSPKKDFTGQTFPDLIAGWPSQTEYNHWIAVFEPHVVTGADVRITQQGDENLVEVVFRPDGGYIWMDAFGKIRKVGLSDYWREHHGDKSPADFVCFLQSDSDGWYISARTDQGGHCPWFVSE